MYKTAVCSTLPQKACPNEASQYILAICYVTLPVKKKLSKSLHKYC